MILTEFNTFLEKTGEEEEPPFLSVSFMNDASDKRVE
jgi:hypothetical protein